MVRHLVEQNMFRVTDVADVDLEDLGQVLERDSVAFVRGLIDPEEVRRFKASFERQFDQGADRPGTGETPEEIMGHLQKLSIGGAAQSGVYRPRFFRTIYTPLWGRDRYGFHRIIRETCKLRNHMYGRSLDFAIDDVEDGLWTAARVHHYPSGGGFLVGHRDTVVPRVHEEVGLGHFYQIIIVLSKVKTSMKAVDSSNSMVSGSTLSRNVNWVTLPFMTVGQSMALKTSTPKRSTTRRPQPGVSLDSSRYTGTFET